MTNASELHFFEIGNPPYTCTWRVFRHSGATLRSASYTHTHTHTHTQTCS